MGQHSSQQGVWTQANQGNATTRAQDPRYGKRENLTNKLMEIPKPNIQQAVEGLRDRDEYKAILQFLRDERERFFGDLRQCSTEQEVMKIAGSIATLDEMLQLLS